MNSSMIHTTDVLAIVPGMPTFCYPIYIPRTLFAYFLPFLAFETILLGLALYRGYMSLRMHHLYGGRFSPLGKVINILIKDSILYFIV